MNDFIFITFFRFIFEFYKFLILQNFPAKIFFWSNLVDSRAELFQQFIVHEFKDPFVFETDFQFSKFPNRIPIPNEAKPFKIKH